MIPRPDRPDAWLDRPDTARFDRRLDATRPEVSVVVPMFNEAENVRGVLARFVESLAAQRRSFELIVVNDGSRDRTGVLLDEIASAEPRLRVIHFARNYGQTAAM